jgi:hypothetical protein
MTGEGEGSERTKSRSLSPFGRTTSEVARGEDGELNSPLRNLLGGALEEFMDQSLVGLGLFGGEAASGALQKKPSEQTEIQSQNPHLCPDQVGVNATRRDGAPTLRPQSGRVASSRPGRDKFPRRYRADGQG